MTNDNDILERIGKRTPYAMPTNLFERMQDQVMDRISEIDREKPVKRHRRAIIVRLSVAAAAIAASVCLVLVLRLGNGDEGNGMSQSANSAMVDKAYDNLSQEERNNLIADYKNDIYMSLQ